jgi:hypothetical protein
MFLNYVSQRCIIFIITLNLIFPTDSRVKLCSKSANAHRMQHVISQIITKSLALLWDTSGSIAWKLLFKAAATFNKIIFEPRWWELHMNLQMISNQEHCSYFRLQTICCSILFSSYHQPTQAFKVQIVSPFSGSIMVSVYTSTVEWWISYSSCIITIRWVCWPHESNSIVCSSLYQIHLPGMF